MRMSIGTVLMGRKRWVLLGGGLAVLVAIAWLLAPARSRTLAATERTAPGVAVDVASATRLDVPLYVEGLGTVQAFYTVKMTARVDGELLEVPFVEGQMMKKGDLIAQIDPRPYQAALDQALAARAKDEAQRTNAKQDLERYMVLAPQDLASKQTVDTQRALVAQLQAQLQADQAAIENARTQLSYTRITSPIEGRTGIRLVDKGNIVHATDTGGIVVVTQVEPIAVIFTLPESALDRLGEAMAAGKVPVAALSQDSRKELDQGEVQLIDNQIDQTTGTIRIKAIFKNKAQRLWPGEFVNARVLLGMQHNAITIPPAALQRGPNGMFAFVVKPDSTVEARPLKVSGNTEETVVIESGLEPGERVAVSNIYRLQSGIRVRINDAAPQVASSAGQAAP
jgi:membrane fusion protein, multidrug efflux system